MKALLELEIEGSVSTGDLKRLGDRVVEAISGTGGPKVCPRLLVETGHTYLEISLDSHLKSSKHPID